MSSDKDDSRLPAQNSGTRANAQRIKELVAGINFLHDWEGRRQLFITDIQLLRQARQNREQLQQELQRILAAAGGSESPDVD